MLSTDIPPCTNQHYGTEWQAELGKSAIKSFFGGDTSVAPDTNTGPKTGFKYQISVDEFPDPRGSLSVRAVDGKEVVYLGQTVARFRAAARPENRLRDPLAAERDAHHAAGRMRHWLVSRSPDWRAGAMPRSQWLYAVLTHMMQAVLPARAEAAESEYDSREVPNAWFPSRAAEEAGVPWRFPATHTVWEREERMWALPRRHQVSRGEGLSNRLWLLERALELFKEAGMVFPIPEPLSRAVETEVQSLFRQAAFEAAEGEWLDFVFEFPEYSRTMTTRDGSGDYLPFDWSAPTQFDEEGDFDISSPSSPTETQERAAKVFTSTRGSWSSRGSRQRQLTKYFTVSEVGENASDDRHGTNWGLLRDGQGAMMSLMLLASYSPFY